MENYQDYLKSFETNMQEIIKITEDETSKEILSEIQPLTEAEWIEAKQSGLFESGVSEDSLKELYEMINEKYPEEED